MGENKPLRVLCVSSNFPNSVRPYEGCWAYTQFKALSEIGAEVRVLSPYFFTLASLRYLSNIEYVFKRPPNWHKAGLEVSGPKIFCLLSGRFFRHRHTQLYKRKMGCIIKRLYENWPFDIVFTQSIVPSATAFLELGKELDFAVSGCIIGEGEVTANIRNPRIREQTINTLKLLDLVTAESHRVAQLASELICGERLIYGVHRGTFPEDMRIDYQKVKIWREHLGLTKNVIAAMYIGHLYAGKGVLDLFEAFRTIADSVPLARLVYVGGGDQEKFLRRRTLKSNLGDRIIFTGAVPYAEIPNLMTVADFLCSPSHTEGLGMVNVEAGFCNRAVIGARTGGIPEVILDGQTGLLFQPQNIDELSEKLKIMFENRDMREGMGKRAFDFVNENHNAHKTTRHLYELLLETVERRRKIKAAR